MLIGNHSSKNLIGEARSAAISVHTNPRNREHNWYPFWGLFVLMLMDNMVHRSILAAQFPLWRLADKLEDPIEEGSSSGSDEPLEDEDLMEAESDEDEDPMGSESDEELSYGSHENMDVDISFSSAGGSTSDETRQRITDFAILMWDTYSSDKKERLSECKEKDDDYDRTKCNDNIFPPVASQIQGTIKKYVPVLVEIKKYPSRVLREELWRVEFENSMTKARKDVVTQVHLHISLVIHPSLTLHSGLLLI